jgi:hypothetical protein
MLKLSILMHKVWEYYSGCTRRSSADICSSSGGTQGERKKDRMKLSLPPKLVEKLIWVLVISLCKIFILSHKFDALIISPYILKLPGCFDM